MQTILTVFHIFLAVGLVGLILIQHGKGADMGAAFGSGASGTVFGAKGSGSFLTRTTAILATLFFVTSMAMAYFATQTNEPEGLMERIDAAPTAVEAPAPESDLPAVPTATEGSDLPAVPAAEGTVEAPQTEDVPAAPAAESDSAATDTADSAPETAPAEESAAPAEDAEKMNE